LFVTPCSSERILTDITICRLCDAIVEKGLNTRRPPTGEKGGIKKIAYIVSGVVVWVIVMFMAFAETHKRALRCALRVVNRIC
jgi:hypothetical protein